jgi:hypothetical protein
MFRLSIPPSLTSDQGSHLNRTEPGLPVPTLNRHACLMASQLVLASNRTVRQPSSTANSLMRTDSRPRTMGSHHPTGPPWDPTYPPWDPIGPPWDPTGPARPIKDPNRTRHRSPHHRYRYRSPPFHRHRAPLPPRTGASSASSLRALRSSARPYWTRCSSDVCLCSSCHTTSPASSGRGIGEGLHTPHATHPQYHSRRMRRPL